MLQLAVRLILQDRLEHARARSGTSQPVSLLQAIPESLQEFSAQVLCLAYVGPGAAAADPAAARRREIIDHPKICAALGVNGLAELAQELKVWSQALVGRVDVHWKPVRATLLASLLNPERADCVFQQAPSTGSTRVRARHIVLASVPTLRRFGREAIVEELWRLHTGVSTSAADGSDAQAGPGNFDPLAPRSRRRVSKDELNPHDELATMARPDMGSMSAGREQIAGVEVGEWFGQEMTDVLHTVFSTAYRQRAGA